MTTEYDEQELKAQPEQLVYANLLFLGAWGGIFIMIATYIIYITGVLPAHVDINSIPLHWGKGVNEYLAITGSPHGWGWAALLHKGDFLNFIGMALLAVMTIICYLTLIPAYIKKKETALTIICILEVLVLSAAASGLLGSGGH